jgi:mono/diheme cytochrome c family protein
MHDNPRYEPLEASSFFADRRSAREPVAGTVARGELREDEHLYTGKVGGKLSATFPFAVTRERLERGRQRYDIYCAPCHDRLGTGLGMVVRRGFRRPPSMHDERLRLAPPGHFFDVMTNGFGAMASYAAEVPVEDRWAIAAYLRALQFSQRAPISAVPVSVRPQLEEEAAAAVPPPPAPAPPGTVTAIPEPTPPSGGKP